MQNNKGWKTIVWIALAVYLAANAYLIFLGEGMWVLLLFANSLYLALLAWLTRRVTQPLPSDELPAAQRKSMIWAQVVLLGAVILLTGLHSSRIPLWSSMLDRLRSLGESVLPVEWFGGPGNSVANPVQYFVIPFILLLAMGAKPSELGLGMGNKVWQACLVWMVLPVVLMTGLVATGSFPLQTLIRRVVGNIFQNGFFEEFLVRGALQTRLRHLMPSLWALALQAIVFGLWHLNANTKSLEGNILGGIALCIVSQTVGGFVYGYVFERTRNLIAPSVAHVVMNVLGQTFG